MTPILATDKLAIPFPIDQVWSVLTDIPAYPNWWPKAVGLRVLNAEPDIVGSAFELRPLGGRSFRSRIDSMEAPKSLRMQYFGGFIEGTGEWRLEPLGSSTQVQYELDVQAAGQLVAWIGKVIPLGRVLHTKCNKFCETLRMRSSKRASAVDRQSNQQVPISPERRLGGMPKRFCVGRGD